MTAEITKQMFANWKQNEITVEIKKQIIEAIDFYRELNESEGVVNADNFYLWRNIGAIQSLKRVLFALDNFDNFIDEEKKKEEK